MKKIIEITIDGVIGLIFGIIIYHITLSCGSPKGDAMGFSALGSLIVYWSLILKGKS